MNQFNKGKQPTTNPRILLCTTYRRFPNDYLEYIGGNVYTLPRVALTRKAAPGLRFLKRNIPGLEILEFPTWEEYLDKLKEGWDVVGFSLFQNQIAEIMQMADEARKQGVKELWAGGYGALDSAIPKIVDRVFLGASEDLIAQAFGKRVEDILHPTISWPMTFLPGNIPHFHMGFIYTQHGCPYKCTFCQTPVFTKAKPSINMDSIEEVLAYYAKIGISDVFIIDELFGLNPKRADIITRLLAKYKLRWWSQSRMALFLHNLDVWYERGLRFLVIGVESMSQKALDGVHKSQTLDVTKEFVRRVSEKPDMYTLATYMIGYQNLNLQETIEDIGRLKRIGFDAHQVNIITPFPQTVLWDELESKYGIFDKVYRHYDAKHLVWNHPHISPKAMNYLLRTALAVLNDPKIIYGKNFLRLIKERFRRHGFGFIWKDLIKTPILSAFTNERKMPITPPNAKDKREDKSSPKSLSKDTLAAVQSVDGGKPKITAASSKTKIS